MPLREGEGCDGDLGPGYSLVFAYLDGSTQTVTGELAGCRAVDVGGVLRESPQEVLGLFDTLLRQQRQRIGQDDVSPRETPACPFELENVLGHLVDVRTGGLCIDDRYVPLSDADVRTILVELVQPEVQPVDCDSPTLSLVGTNRWGDRVALHSCGETWSILGEYVQWSPATREIVNRARRR